LPVFISQILIVPSLLPETIYFPSGLIVTDPLLLLADEPTGNLDSIKSIEVMELLKKLNEELNITIIMVTHEEEMAAYASRVIYFRDGNIEDSLKKGFK
jgi:putative ABC transport system ATP-binding protein